MVKKAFATASRSGTPEGLPVELPEHAPHLRLLAKGDEADPGEVEANPRAASARLRAAQRLRPGRLPGTARTTRTNSKTKGRSR